MDGDNVPFPTTGITAGSNQRNELLLRPKPSQPFRCADRVLGAVMLARFNPIGSGAPSNP
jgi:hypothetical protein